MGAVEYLQNSLEHSLLWPAYDELGNFENKFFLVSPATLAIAYVSHKEGLEPFVEGDYLSRKMAEKFIKNRKKRNLWNRMKISKFKKDKSSYSRRGAKIWVKSTSGYNIYYQMQFKNMPTMYDNEREIITTLPKLKIRHIGRECGLIANTYDYTISRKLVKKWLDKEELKKPVNLELNLLCCNMLDAWLKLANDPYRDYAMHYGGVFKEENIGKHIGPLFHRIEEGTFDLQTLNKLLSPELFENIGLTELINEDLYEALGSLEEGSKSSRDDRLATS